VSCSFDAVKVYFIFFGDFNDVFHENDGVGCIDILEFNRKYPINLAYQTIGMVLHMMLDLHMSVFKQFKLMLRN
jgi:hypothetical protein